MDFGGHFERLVRMVQETGERVVFSCGDKKDPVVLLSLSQYEHLIQRSSRDSASLSTPPSIPLDGLRPLSQHFSSGPRPLVRAPVLSVEEFSQESADVWDGEQGGEYDAERIFASAAVGTMRAGGESGLQPTSPVPERLQASVSRASAVYGTLQQRPWQEGSGGQRLPIRGEGLSAEERFSLGMG